MYYYGISLGGIMGTWFSALTPDIQRFGVDVPAINFSCLLQRSTQFSSFDALLTASASPIRCRPSSVSACCTSSG